VSKQLSLNEWLKVFMAYCCERGRRSFPKPTSSHWNILFFSYKDLNPDSSVVLDDVRKELAIMNVKEDVITERDGGRIALKNPELVLSWLRMLQGRTNTQRILEKVFERVTAESSGFFPESFKKAEERS
jgi:hypothetical protein